MLHAEKAPAIFTFSSNLGVVGWSARGTKERRALKQSQEGQEQATLGPFVVGPTVLPAWIVPTDYSGAQR